ncbi:MAG TPA: hypothetical protein VMV86_04525 [Methanosarcinales archaeon]|nr:hypothetical protein [Methanosarcinales archaeon]
MASNTIKIMLNDVISFNIDDVGMRKLLELLGVLATLNLDCTNCGLTVLPQARSHFVNTQEEEFTVRCVKCGVPVKVRMYRDYGFVVTPEHLTEKDL